MTGERSYVCLCGHAIGAHVLYRDQLAPGTPYHWGGCTVDGCGCRAAINETGSIVEMARTEARVEPEHVLRDRAKLREELARSIAWHRQRGEDWVGWLDKRRRLEHDHGAVRVDGTAAACPVPGCDAMHESGML